MRILMDTSILLWAVVGDPRITPVSEYLTSPDNIVYFSAASIWEIAIKYLKGNLETPPDEVRKAALAQGYTEMPVTSDHAIAVNGLQRPESLKHNDPFDRIMLAQAKCEKTKFFTSDGKISLYDEPCIRRV